MDDLLGLNEINTITHCNLNCYFEEEDKKEELYIKMIEDRIMFKIRKEIIEPLISDFNVKTDINMCEILKLKDDVSELKECVEREKNKNIELTDIIDLLRAQLFRIKNIIKDNVRQSDNLSNIISNLKVYSPNISDTSCAYVNKSDMKDITTEKILYQHSDIYTNGCVSYTSPKLYIKPFYNLKILQIFSARIVNFQDMYSNYLTHLIIGYGSDQFKILNLKYLPLLNIIEIHNTWYTDLNELIKELSSYKHNIQNFIFTDCDFIRNVKYQENFNNFKTYCEENNITLNITFAPPPIYMGL